MSVAETAGYAPTKVLVRSRYREVRVCTSRDHVTDFDAEGRPVTVERKGYRQFRDHECFMTLEEAEFIVNDEGNLHLAKVDQPSYFFPAGIPAPVPSNWGGVELAPPFADDSAGVDDPRVAAAAERQRKAKEKSLAEFKAAQAEGGKGKSSKS